MSIGESINLPVNQTVSQTVSEPVKQHSAQLVRKCVSLKYVRVVVISELRVYCWKQETVCAAFLVSVVLATERDRNMLSSCVYNSTYGTHIEDTTL